MIEGKNIHFSPVDSKPLCSFSAKLCKLRRLNGYAFCVRHILEDSSAPFKQCEFVVKSTGQRCSAAIPHDENRSYCHSHMQVMGLLPKKERKRKNYLVDSHEDVDHEPALNDATHGNLDQSDMQLPVDIVSAGSSPALDDLCATPSSAANLSPTSNSEREASAEPLGLPVATGGAAASQIKHGADDGAAKDRRPGQAGMLHSKVKTPMSDRAVGSRSRGSDSGRGRGANVLSRRGCKVSSGRSRADRQSPAFSGFADPSVVCASHEDSAVSTLTSAASQPPHRDEMADRPSGMFAVLASVRNYTVDLSSLRGQCSDKSLFIDNMPDEVRALAADSLWNNSYVSPFMPDLSPTKQRHDTLLSPLSSPNNLDGSGKAFRERLKIERHQFSEADASLQRYARLLIACARSSCSATASALLYASGRKQQRLSACTTSICQTTDLTIPAATALRRTRESISNHARARGKGCRAFKGSATFKSITSLRDDGGLAAVTSPEICETRAICSPQSESGKQTHQEHPQVLHSKVDLPEPPSQIPVRSSDILTADDTLLSPITKAMLDLPLDHVEAADLLDDCEIQQVLNKLPDDAFGVFNNKLCS